jgi:L-arabinose isomerase
MSATPHAGLLPLYLALYDECLPDLRPQVAAFAAEVAQSLRGAGLRVSEAPICTVRPEFEAALADLVAADVALVVTLHLAYSPSLESVDALAACGKPIVMLDTTPDADFGRHVDPALLLANHGIHGVQDLAAMLRRRGAAYRVVAGHLSNPEPLRRTAELARAALAARRFGSMRALRVGFPFAGMGDFAVEEETLRRRLGIEASEIAADALAPFAAAVTDEEIDAEVAADRAAFQADLPADVHRTSVRVGLGLRRALEAGGYGAFSVNFQAFVQADGPVCTVPFLECCKAMARDVGYAGEGDLLTASLVGALLAGWEGVTFTEMFCADWQGDGLFLSHMGEVNPASAAATPRLYEKAYPFSPAQNPATLACALRPGPATLVNLSPGPDESFRLIAAEVEVLEDGTHAARLDWIRSWVRPQAPVARFLETYSQLGGTHHCALMPGIRHEALAEFARIAGLEFRPVEAGR